MIIDNDVIFKVSDELGYELTEIQIDMVKELYPKYDNGTDYYDEIIEKIIINEINK